MVKLHISDLKIDHTTASLFEKTYTEGPVPLNFDISELKISEPYSYHVAIFGHSTENN